MDEFTAKFADQIAGTLNGFDRLVFRGTLRKIAYPFGMQGYLWANQVPMTEFGAHVNEGQCAGQGCRAALCTGGWPWRAVLAIQQGRQGRNRARHCPEREILMRGPSAR